MTTPRLLQNFGKNIRIQSSAYYEPHGENEVLAILDRHRGEQIRSIGRLHSWSEAPGGEGVILNLKHLQQFQCCEDNGRRSVIVGAGCQIKTILKRLKRQGWTLPSVGLINEQTIAGAISTGTHGSGKNSLSHYVIAVRIARYDIQSGTAVIEEFSDGDELRAARCSLGCLGVILSVTLQCREQYRVEEHLREYDTLEAVLQAESQFPLQQFFLTPWRWTYLAQHRRETAQRKSLFRRGYRIYWFTSIDIGLHILILTVLRLLGSFRAIRFMFRRIIPNTVIRSLRVTDDSASMLVMEHELFRHIEMEIFVTRSKLPAALDFVQSVLEVVGQKAQPIPELGIEEQQSKRLAELSGQYGHHYPICIRRVQPDDTLISMSSGGEEDWYAISLISYARPNERQSFLKTMEFLAATMSVKFGARLHWGKYCPLPPAELVASYPQFGVFQSICESHDPRGVFRNRWLNELFAAGTVSRG